MMSLKEPSFLDDNLEVDPAETAKAWSKFLSHRNAPSLPCMGVRPLIYRSWERSNKTGIRAEQFAAPSHKKIELDEKQIFYQSEMRRATQKCLYNMNAFWNRSYADFDRQGRGHPRDCRRQLNS
jgi:hypothetical protein